MTMTKDEATSYGDVRLEELMEELRQSEVKFINLKSRVTDYTFDLKQSEEARLKLVKIKNYLQEQLRKAGEEIKNLKAEVKYERQLRLEGAKHH